MITTIKKARKYIYNIYYDKVKWPNQVTEREHLFSKARNIYLKEGNRIKNGSLSPSTMNVEVIVPGQKDGIFQLPDNYLDLVKKIAQEADHYLRYTKNLSFIRNTVPIEGDLPELVNDLPEYKEKKLVKWSLKDVTLLPTVEKLCQELVPLIEESIYHSYVSLDIPYMYCIRDNVVGRGSSLLWHTDNHHIDSLKVMIYLHDVDENMGPFEYMSSPENKPIYVPVQRPEFYPKGRVPDEKILEYEKFGFKHVKVTGPIGTTILFSENMIHRGNIPKDGIRKVLLLQFKPGLHRQKTFLK